MEDWERSRPTAVLEIQMVSVVSPSHGAAGSIYDVGPEGSFRERRGMNHRGKKTERLKTARPS